MEQFLGHDLGDCGIEKVEQGIWHRKRNGLCRGWKEFSIVQLLKTTLILSTSASSAFLQLRIMWFHFLALIQSGNSTRHCWAKATAISAHLTSPDLPWPSASGLGRDFVLHDRHLIQPVSCYALTYIEAGAWLWIDGWMQEISSDRKLQRNLVQQFGVGWLERCLCWCAQTQKSKH